jgi:hypothetical protein
MKNLVFALFFLLSISACQKDNVLTFGQQAANKIQTEVQQAGATKATVYIGELLVAGDDDAFSFDGEFISVGSSRYNLNKLLRYRIINSQGAQRLILYF